MKKENLICIFETAEETKMDIAVEISVPGQSTTEVIITRYENLNNKLEFYKKAYDENGIHCMNNNVKIINAWCVNFYKYYDNQNGEIFTVGKED